MSSRTLLRLLLALVLLALVVPVADAQRGKRKKGKGPKRGGARLLLPAPVSPQPKLKIDPLTQLTTGLGIKGRRPGAGSLLPDPDSAAGELPELPAFDLDGSPFPWTDPRDPELEAHYFDVCDHDDNEWISYREAQISLSLTRPSYALFDTDRDGRIRREEFSTRYEEVVRRSGGFPPPKRPMAGPPGSAASVAATPEVSEAELALQEVRAKFLQFDTNRNGKLEALELGRVIDIYELTSHGITSARIVEATDYDGSGAIEEGELAVLDEALAIARRRFVGIASDPPGLVVETPESAESLGAPSVAPALLDPTSVPPMTKTVDRGPRTRFDRLDLDADGYVTVDELGRLQSPIVLSVRTSAVIASLDRDGDGRLSRTEFENALD